MLANKLISPAMFGRCETHAGRTTAVNQRHHVSLHQTVVSCVLRRAKEEAARQEVLARQQCTFSPRINRPSGGGAVSSRHGQPNDTAPSAASPQLVRGTV